MSEIYSRRSFLKAGAVACGTLILPNWIIGAQKSPNEKLNVAIVGVGGRGSATVSAVANAQNANMVAFCDVDDARAAQTYAKYPNVPRFKDYRVMLDKMGKSIDAVAVCTPDHMHFPICAWAIANGKHVFCEKPLTRTMWESKEIRRLAKVAGVKTQMGNQGHTFDGWKIAREWYESGLLGDIEDIYMWTDRPSWAQGNITPPHGEKIPSTLDYDLWVGAAPKRYEYAKQVVPFGWRGTRDYGTGAAGDMACHFFDTPYSALDLGFPETVIAHSSKFNDYSWPNKANIEMVFANKRGAGGKIKLHWFDGKQRPKAVKGVSKEFLDDPRNMNCLFIVGSKNTFNGTHYGTESTLFPREKMVEAKKGGMLPPQKYPRSKTKGNPQADWINCCISSETPESNFDYAAPFNELVMLGMVSVLMPERELRYDPKTMTFPNCREADRFTHSLYDYRKEFLPA